MSNQWIEAVKEFHRKFGIPVLARPQFPEWNRSLLRDKLISEEVSETRHAMLHGHLVEYADGLADVIYVCIGAALEHGIDLDPIFAEVHRTNMAKEGGATRADGKLLKPVGWHPPDIARLLSEQIAK
jgi:predicted HAD superfamily Cof-like phosphohydrolase